MHNAGPSWKKCNCTMAHVKILRSNVELQLRELPKRQMSQISTYYSSIPELIDLEMPVNKEN